MKRFVISFFLLVVGFLGASEESIFIERVNSYVNSKPFGNYLFTREAYCNCDQNIELSKSVFNEIYALRPSYIDFNIATLEPFDYGGTCTSMALDFLARYKNECEQLPTKKEQTFCIKGFRTFYRMDNETFISRQAAFNTIEVDLQVALQDPELIKAQKMQALANYHRLFLVPATPSMPYSDKNLERVIKNLPDGTYIIRAHAPTENYKWEVFGHTMIFIKNKKLRVLYDNSKGAELLPSNYDAALAMRLKNWGIPEIRFYQAFCNVEGCINLSTQKN